MTEAKTCTYTQVQRVDLPAKLEWRPIGKHVGCEREAAYHVGTDTHWERRRKPAAWGRPAEPWRYFRVMTRKA